MRSRIFIVWAVCVTAALGQPPRSVRKITIITGAPYSADQLQTYTRTMPDGTSTTTSNVISHYARDSQGRMRTEEALKSSELGWRIEIFDPVERVAYSLDEKTRTAHRYPLPPGPADGAPAAPSRATVDKLGVQTIDGVLAEGKRTSFGALTIETWEAADLKGVTLASKSSNGYSGRLVNLLRAEPDRSRFQPPADYRIVDEKEPLAVTIPPVDQPL